MRRGWGEEQLERAQQQGVERGLEQGRARGLSEAILRILASRRVYVHEEARQRILTCTDVAMLDRWFDRSLNATTLSAVLDDLAQ